MWNKLYIAEGAVGSEKGLIILDEEYKGSCRITLEQCPKYSAITCGVYGAMVHTAFCFHKEAPVIFEEMKKELADFIDKKTTVDEEYRFYDYFTSKY